MHDHEAPRRRAGVIIDPPVGDRRIVSIPASGRYFRLGLREAAFLERLDGACSRATLQQRNGLALTAEQVDRLIQWFAANNLLETAASDAASARPQSWRDRAINLAHPDRWRIHLTNPDRFLDRYRALVDALFSRPALGIYLFVIMAPALVFVAWPQPVAPSSLEMVPALSFAGWVALYLMLLSMNVLHELAHAVACKHFGGRVERIGLMFMFLHPVLYCNVSDSWRFTDANRKIVVSFAGVFLQLLLTCAATTAWLFSKSPVLLFFMLVNTGIAVFNLFPFIKLDGYWMLVHLLDEPNLTKKGLWSVDRMIRRLVEPRGPRQAVQPVILVFGVFHAISVAVFWISGLYGIHHYCSILSPVLGWIATAAFGLPLAWRATRAGFAYAKSFSTQSTQWRAA